MHQSIPPAPRPSPPPPPGLLRGICPPCHFPGPFPSFWHARGFLSEYNYTGGFTEKKKQIGSSLRDRDKLKRVVKASSRFYACISSLLIKPELPSENWSYRCESTLFGYWIKFLLILFEKHPFIFIFSFVARLRIFQGHSRAVKWIYTVYTVLGNGFSLQTADVSPLIGCPIPPSKRATYFSFTQDACCRIYKSCLQNRRPVSRLASYTIAAPSRVLYTGPAQGRRWEGQGSLTFWGKKKRNIQFQIKGIFDGIGIFDWQTSPKHPNLWLVRFDLISYGDPQNDYSYICKIQLAVYYQCCVLMGWATTRLSVIAH